MQAPSSISGAEFPLPSLGWLEYQKRELSHATQRVVRVFTPTKKIHLGRIFLLTATIILLFIAMIKVGPTVLAFAQMQEADDCYIKADGQVLLVNQSAADSRSPLQVHAMKEVWLYNRDPMQPVRVYKLTLGDPKPRDLDEVKFRAPLTSEGLYEIKTAHGSRFARLNWSEN